MYGKITMIVTKNTLYNTCVSFHVFIRSGLHAIHVYSTSTNARLCLKEIDREGALVFLILSRRVSRGAFILRIGESVLLFPSKNHCEFSPCDISRLLTPLRYRLEHDARTSVIFMLVSSTPFHWYSSLKQTVLEKNNFSFSLMRVFPICFKQDQSVDEKQTKVRITYYYRFETILRKYKNR